MLIPLDYYRILGLPIQATAGQLEQAHRDRLRQLPRREYSEAAIAERNALIDEAYEVLCDPQQRHRYDASFLSQTYETQTEALGEAARGDRSSLDVAPNTPSLDIPDHRFIGALLILHELGEYELVLNLGRTHLRDRLPHQSGNSGSQAAVRADIVLTIALAYLELGREQWQQNQYESAASSLEAGQALLLREGLFPNVRGEMQADLYKLRPYRILELLALPESRETERQRGLQLLGDMLQERGGIDGTGDDRSGLDIDDFLRFVQQLRAYLTAAEQQALFEREARRPSAVATYLAVYAAIARGFAQRQPNLIHHAKLMLRQLGRRQDVHLEQAVCALLLGQTDEASRALELSQEEAPLEFIRERSQDAPDLLPGLCLYGERWLQDEVFPHFRDLADRKASLKDYFADEQVQANLEALPSEAEVAGQWVAVPPTPAAPTQARSWRDRPNPSPAPPPSRPNPSPIAPTISPSVQNGTSTLPEAVRSAPSRPFEGSRGIQPPPAPSVPQPPPSADENPFSTAPEEPPPREPSPRSRDVRFSPSTGDRPHRARRTFRLERLLVLIAALLLGLGAIGFVLNKTFGWLAGSFDGLSGVPLEGEQASVQLGRPPIDIPDPQQAQVAATGPLTPAAAQQVIQTWLSVKSAAFGEQYQIDRLSEILVDPARSTWQERAEVAREQNWYWNYDHSVEVESVETSEEDPDLATAVVSVRETGTLYENGRQAETRDSTLAVSYELVRREGRWMIRDWTVLN